MGLVCPGPNPFMKGAGVQVHQRRASCVKGVALEDNSPRISHERCIFPMKGAYTPTDGAFSTMNLTGVK